jgi:hypothetical protein
MSMNKSVTKLEPSKRSSHGSEAVLATITILFATLILANKARSIQLLSYATTLVTWMIANLSMIRVPLIIGLGGSLLSIPLIRRRSRSEPVPTKPDKPRYPSQLADIHPLLLIPRPSRDPKFIIKKTKKRGRISRNRAGQRLPANPLDKDESDLD